MFTDDPIADFLRHDREERRWLNSRPLCAYCNEPIQDEYLFEINGETICMECLIDEHRKLTENYVERR